jgi:hypothetical protein
MKVGGMAECVAVCHQGCSPSWLVDGDLLMGI